MTYKGVIDEVKMLSQNPMMPDIFKPSLNKIAETLEMETEIETCDDCISRKKAVFALNDAQVEYDENYKGLGEAKEIIDNLPSVRLKPKMRYWIKHDTGHSIYYDCSVCGCVAPCTRFGDGFIWKLSAYCPDCGAKMESEDRKYDSWTSYCLIK